MELGITGRKALVCGASKGLGFACAQTLAEEGVAVTLVSRSQQSLEAAANKIGTEASVTPRWVVADLSTPAGRATAIAACPDADILVTNAGGPPKGRYQDLTRGQWQQALEVNFLSAVELIRSSLEGMSRRGFGRIVNVTSMTVRMPVRNLDLSNATRLALTGYVAGVAREVALYNVTINNLLPGPIATERLRELGDAADQLISGVPAGRAGRPEEFGAACAFLCSAKASFITGQNLLVDGGLCPITV